jgi:excisionase family DNA binding protein
MNDGSVFVRASEIADELGLSPRRVYQLIREKQIPAVRMGRSIRIPRDAWDSWLDELTDKALRDC